MKKYTVWFLLICVACLCDGCIQSIDVDLLSDQPTVVIKGLVTDQPGPYYVRLHYSRGDLALPSNAQSSFYQLDKFEPINDALVILADNTGNIDTLELWQQPEIRPDNDTSHATVWNNRGVYQTKNFPQAQAGINYQLTVTHRGKTYTAEATMPFPAPSIDQITFTPNGEGDIPRTGAGGFFFPTLSFGEPQNQKNYYRVVAKHQEFIASSGDSYGTWLNGPDNFWPIPYLNYFIVNDRLLKPQVKDLIANVGPSIHSGGLDFKEVNVQLHSITQEAYEFFAALQEQRKNNEQKIFSIAPASLPTNIQGGGLGFFTVTSVSKRRVPHPDLGK